MKKAKHSLPFSALTLAFSLLASGAAQAEWIKSYGTNNNEFGTVMPSSQDSYYLSMLSTSISTAKSVALLSLLDANGVPAWTKKITTGAFDSFLLSELNDGRLLLQGKTQLSANGSGNAVWAVYNVNRVTGALSPVFSKSYPGKGNDELTITQDNQGGLWGTGSTTSFSQDGKGKDMIVAKINATTGTPIWSKVFHSDYKDAIAAFIPQNDKYILLANTTSTSGDSQKILIGLLNNLGAPVGSFKKFGGSGINNVVGIKAISGGSYLVYGTNLANVQDQHPTIFVMKLSPLLKYVWGKKLTAGADQGMYVSDINENTDHSLTLTANLNATLYANFGGFKVPIGASAHPAAIQLSSAGAVTSAKSFEYQDTDTSNLYKTSNGNYLLGGQTSKAMDMTNPTMPNTDMLYGQFNATMSPNWVKTLGGQNIDSGVITSQPTGYLLSGATMSWSAGYMDLLAGKIDANGDVPGCTHINEVSMIETTPTISDSNLNWQAQTALLVNKGAITSTNIAINVTPATMTTTTVCGN